MDSNKQDLLYAVLQAAGGEIVGRIRLQKIVYLLEQLGMNGSLNFAYYHFGPYSEDVSRALDLETLTSRRLSETEAQTQAGYTFSIFRTKTTEARPEKVGDLPMARASALIQIMKAPTSTEIELAATIHWLRHHEKIADWRKELGIRKGAKGTPDRVKRAIDLLCKVGLEHDQLPEQLK